MAVRAKFYVRSITKFADPKGGGSVALSPVFASKEGISGNACEENHIFGQYTPSGEINMCILNPAALEQFELGKPYYVDFSPAPE